MCQKGEGLGSPQLCVSAEGVGCWGVPAAAVGSDGKGMFH